MKNVFWQILTVQRTFGNRMGRMPAGFRTMVWTESGLGGGRPAF